MSHDNEPIGGATGSAEVLAVGLKMNPFLHVDPDQIYNPLNDRSLKPDDHGFAELQQVYEEASTLPAL